MWSNKCRGILYSLLIILIITIPINAEKIVKVYGDKMQYLESDDLLNIYGNAKVVTDDVIISGETIQALFQKGEVIEIKAMGGVTIQKGDDTYSGQELTYHIKDEKGLILDIEAQTSLEDTDELAYLSGREATYTDDLIDILDGHFTTCDLDHPHYLFKAKRIKIYPEDKIQAYHVTFWEFNGTIPLFYWPYYSKSLKDEKNKFTPSVGYSATTGWFIKTLYSFYSKDENDDKHGELYLDYYQKLGFGGGAKYFYMDEKDKQGYASIYMQQTGDNTSISYLDLEHFQTYKWENLDFSTSSNLLQSKSRNYGTNVTKLSYANGTNKVSWESNFTGYDYLSSNIPSYSWKNVLSSTFKVYGVNFSGKYTLDQQLDSPDRNYWNGDVKLNSRFGIIDWTLLARKAATSSNKTTYIYTLPELELRVYYSRLTNKILRPYISPLSHIMKAGHYIQNSTETDAYKLYNKLTYQKQIKLWGPISITPRSSFTYNIYSTSDYSYNYDPSIELRISQREGLFSTIKYLYQKGDGTSPFTFDKPLVTDTQNVTASVGYTKSGFTVSSGATYNIKSRYFTILNNKAVYKVDNNTFELILPYNLQTNKFNEITAKANLKYTDFKLDLNARFDPLNMEFKELESDLDWQINEDWHIQSEIGFDPSKGFDLTDSETKATVELVRNLHCREISVNYDFVQKEIWFQYNIIAFPKEKVRIGSSPDEPIQVDLNLGGMRIGK